MTRVVFMGTPEFAVPSLGALVDGGYEVAAAFTQPDRPSGRHHALTICPVKRFCQPRGIPVFQFERVRRPEGIEAMRGLAPDLIVTAAFGQILPQALLDIPRLGTVNVHASLLPKYRGAAPINWCIIEGETVAGVTTMLTDAGIDTGDILMRRSIEILPGETAGELTVRLSELGADLLIETFRALESGVCPRIAQDPGGASYQPTLTKETGRIDFAQPARRVVNLVRGVNPWPGAYAALPGGAPLKVWVAVEAADADLKGGPGEVLASGPRRGLIVGCGDGTAVEFTEIQAPGGKRMPADAYLRGKPIPAGTMLNEVPCG